MTEQATDSFLGNWAKKIEELQAELATVTAERDELMKHCEEGWMNYLEGKQTAEWEAQEQLATVTAERDELVEALKLIVSADDRGFGISYVKGCAQSALAKLNDGKGE